MLDPEVLWHHPSPYPLHRPYRQKLAGHSLELESKVVIAVAVASVESPQQAHLLVASVNLAAVMAEIVGSAVAELAAELTWPLEPQ